MEPVDKKPIAEKRWANFLGFESIDGVGRKRYHLFVIRGNGTLTLTSKELLFTRLLPKKTFVIPIETTTTVSIGHSHNLKYILFPILKVSFVENGSTRIFGVCVGGKRTTLEWKDHIERTMRSR